MKHLFIVNPVAGKGYALRRIAEIKEYFETGGKAGEEEYEIRVTEYPGHATEIAREYSSAQNLRIYSVGGDGTLNETLNGMAGSGSILGVIPSGSGNDFIRSIAGDNIPENIIRHTVEGKEKPVDYARINDKYFINIASLGFDAEVAYQTNHFKKLPLISGSMAYVLGILSTISICKNHHMELRTDNGVLSGKTLLVAVGIGKYYGGGVLALPDAEVDDGLFDICYVEAKPRLDILRLFTKYMKGLHREIEGVHLIRSKSVEIIPDEPIPLNRDGEIVMADKAVFEIFPKGIPFIVPSVPRQP
ncbi:MAG: diacylglycerol/lipid kinase family protein [Acetivibrionales bacterium]|jgi:YegS/Rv2252/BmrU family lipid kinase